MTSKKSEKTRQELEKFKERLDRRSVSQVTEEFFAEFFSPATTDKRQKPQESSATESPPTPATHPSQTEAEPSDQLRGQLTVRRSTKVASHQPATFENVASHQPATFENVASHSPVETKTHAHYITEDEEHNTKKPSEMWPATFENVASQPATFENVASHQPATFENVASHKPVYVAENEEDDADKSSEMWPATFENVASQPATFENVASHKPATFENVAGHKKSIDIHKTKDRHKSGRSMLSIRLNTDIANKIKQFCAEANIDIQDFIELSASHYIDNVAIQPATFENVASHTQAKWPAHDDINDDDINDDNDDDNIIAETQKTRRVAGHTQSKERKIPWSTDRDIIALYQSYTGNRWKPTDDQVGKDLHEIDRRIIEIGILQTLLNAKGRKIHSFAYFMPEIQVLIEVNLQKETLDAFLQTRRQQWQAVQKQRSSQRNKQRAKGD
jgi:hypothetical protein